MPKWKAFIRGPGLHEELNLRSTSLVPGQNDNASEVASLESTLNGDEAKVIYEQIINEPSSTFKDLYSPNVTINKPLPKPISKPKSQRLEQLMRLCETNNVEQLETYFKFYPEEIQLKLDQCDQYGWTLLMTAAVSNSYECVKLLLKLGSDWTIRDKSGLTVFQLARKNQKSNICELIRSWILNRNQEQDECLGEMEREGKERYCEACGVLYKNDIHGKSIAHLVCTNQDSSETKIHYGIPESNKGFQLMLKNGWNRGGLGSSGEGQKFPVKTILKRDRNGLGRDKSNKMAKVTHFDPFDTAAVESINRRVERVQTVKKEEFQSRRRKERSKEINFRRDFSAIE